MFFSFTNPFIDDKNVFELVLLVFIASFFAFIYFSFALLKLKSLCGVVLWLCVEKVCVLPGSPSFLFQHKLQERKPEKTLVVRREF